MEPTAILAAIALVPQPAKLVETGGAAPASAEVRYVEDASVPAEGYRLSVATNGVTVASSDAAGRFYAGVTLEQLARPDGSRPCVEIEDAPAFPWRGMHLDVSRHFFTADEVKRFLDLMAAHKLNRFHWHLTDNQGWRLDVPSHPELAAASAEKRGKTIEGRPDENRGEDFAGPCFYTEEQVRDIVAYAAARHIEIVPEIEMPGHFGSVLAAHPEFACTDADGKRTGWNELCVGNDEAIACLEDVLDDVCRLFPFGVVHVGGDECSRDRWRECPKCRARIEAESLADEDALQTWLSARMVRFLDARGKRAIGWDEYLLGDGISTNAIGMRWRGAGGAGGGPSNFVSAASLAAAGHDLVMASSRWVYLDYPQGLPDDPYVYTFDKQKPLDLCYRFDPLLDIPPELHHRVLGGEGCNWTERTATPAMLEWKLWPRGCALAECLWCGPARKPSYEDFLRRLEVHRARLVADGVNAAPLPPPQP
ncbi:MAG: beta-N-acetylhexosaminidase [Kiritimatiellae bacterium]|nr:beta-N-acetylhexosaminidase [Kiritimatiellia bacterium]